MPQQQETLTWEKMQIGTAVAPLLWDWPLSIGLPELSAYWSAVQPTFASMVQSLETARSTWWSLFTGRTEEVMAGETYDTEAEFYGVLRDMAEEAWVELDEEQEFATLDEFLSQFPIEVPPAQGGD